MTPFFISRHDPLTLYYGANKLVRIVEAGGPLTSKQKLRQAFKVWCAAHDRTEKHLRLVGLRREPRPAQTLAEVMGDE